MICLQDVEAARGRIADQLLLTPCTPTGVFGDLFGGNVWFKFENLQRTGSFKERGALNHMLLMDRAARRRGVIAASAGNHAQGIAYHAGRLGIAATIVMPERTPLIKVTNTERFGARVVLHGASYDEAALEALRLQREEGQTLIHPFDDLAVIAGQGTIGLELLEQCPGLEAVVVPLGGGGLVSGIALALKEHRPGVRVIGVEAENLPAALRSRAAGGLVTIDPGETIADGIAVRRIGENTHRLIERYVDDLVTVTEEEIAAAVLLLLEREKTVAEPAAAAPLAAAVAGRLEGLDNRAVAMVLSGGNIDVNLLSRIIERGLIHDGRLAMLEVRVKDRPGALAALAALLGEEGANILQLDHRRGSRSLRITEVEVQLTLETRGHEHVEAIVASLSEAGYRVRGQGGSPAGRG
jgi:threonine dehydratase